MALGQIPEEMQRSSLLANRDSQPQQNNQAVYQGFISHHTFDGEPVFMAYYVIIDSKDRGIGKSETGLELLQRGPSFSGG